MGTGYFVDTNNGKNWDNLTYWAPAGAVLSATYTLSSYTTSASVTLSYNILNNSCPLGICGTGRVAFAAATIQYGTSTPVTILAQNCTIGGEPYFNYTHTLTSSELQQALTNGIITVTVKSCAISNANLEYQLTASIDTTISSQGQTGGSITVTITTPAGPPSLLYPATVTLVDTSTNTNLGSQTATSSTVTFSNLTIGDNYTVTVSMPPFADNSSSLELTSTSGNATVSLSCGTGKYYQPSVIGAPQCLYNSSSTPSWLTAVEIGVIGAAVIAGVVSAAYITGAIGGTAKTTQNTSKSLSQSLSRGLSRIKESITGKSKGE